MVSSVRMSRDNGVALAKTIFLITVFEKVVACASFAFSTKNKLRSETVPNMETVFDEANAGKNLLQLQQQ